MHIRTLIRPVRKSILGFLLAAIIMPLHVQAREQAAREQDPVAEILLILKDRGDISQERYDELMGGVRRQAETRAQSATPAGEQPQAPTTAPLKEGEFVVYWRDGPKFETRDGDVTFAISGRIHNHYGDVMASDDLVDAFGEIDDSRAIFRRARVGLAGTFYDRFGFKAEYDFAGGDANFTDVFIEAYKLPALGTLTVGHFKAPMSVDEMTSTNNNWFIERSLPNEAFYPGRDTGFMFRNSVLDNRLTYALAGVVDAGSFGDDEFDEDPADDEDPVYSLVAHIHGSPWVQSKNAVHLGLSYQRLFLNEDDVRYRARPETALTSTRFVDTGDLDADHADLLISEFAAVYGPWNVVAEYFWNPVELDEDSVDLSGYYALVSYFLTGETRPYNAQRGGFGSVKPLDPMDFENGMGTGAWELALRYSFLDLDEDGEGVDGGRERNITAGLNWYPISPVRFMLNYTWANIDDRTVDGVTLDDETAHIIQSRFQVAF